MRGAFSVGCIGGAAGSPGAGAAGDAGVVAGDSVADGGDAGAVVGVVVSGACSAREQAAPNPTIVTTAVAPAISVRPRLKLSDLIVCPICRPQPSAAGSAAT
jgi:hypothetical protein